MNYVTVVLDLAFRKTVSIYLCERILNTCLKYLNSASLNCGIIFETNFRNTGRDGFAVFRWWKASKLIAAVDVMFNAFMNILSHTIINQAIIDNENFLRQLSLLRAAYASLYQIIINFVNAILFGFLLPLCSTLMSVI